MAGIGDFVTGIFGSKNKSSAKKEVPKIDPKAYLYGGTEGGANDAAGRYAALGASAQERGGARLITGPADQARAQQEQARVQQGQARDVQLDALGMQRSAALGQQPSVAAIQQRQGVDAAMRSQQALAAGARGQAALAGAQYNAAQNTGAIQQGAVNEAAKLRAGEMAQARGAFDASAQGLRSGDMSLRGQDQATRQQDLTQATTQAQLTDAQRARNDAMQLGMTGYETGVRQSQLNASMMGQQQASNNALGAATVDQKTAEGNANRNQSNALFGAGTIAGAAGAVASDERNKDVVGAVDAPVTWGDGSNRAPRVGPAEAYADRPNTGLQSTVMDMMGANYAGGIQGGTDPKLAKGMGDRFGAFGRHVPGLFDRSSVKGPDIKQQQQALRSIIGDSEPSKADTSEFGQGKVAGAALGGLAGAALGGGSKTADVLTHPGRGGTGALAHGDEANAKVYASHRYYGGAGQEYGDIAYGDTPVYANNAGGGSSVEGGRKGSEAGRGGNTAGKMGALSDAHSKNIIANLESKNELLRTALGEVSRGEARVGQAEPPKYIEPPASKGRKSLPERMKEAEGKLPEYISAKGEEAPKRREPAPMAPIAAPTPMPPGRSRFASFLASGGPPGIITRAAAEAAQQVQPSQLYATSDERQKAPAASAPQTSETARFLDTLNSWAYRYKPGVGEDPSKMRFGPMAQEVEKTPVGASFVENTPQGKMLDIQHGFPVALGALGNLNDRLRAIESRKKGAR
jgi:hypothetical protein